MLGERVGAVVLAVLVSLASGCGGNGGRGPRVKLTVGGHAVRAELADTPKRHERGLMFREQLPDDEGMLFCYEESRVLSFWMKNTRIPLSIAFITGDGAILNIEDMEPYSLKTHRSHLPARYALEMNQGWFREHNVGEGAKVDIPDSARGRGR